MGMLTYRLGNGVFGTIDANDPLDPIQVSIVGTSTLVITSVDYTKAYSYDSNGNLQYEGFAVPGSAISSPVWKIKRYTNTLIGGTYVVTAEQWANGSNVQTQVYDNRASLNYS